MFKYLPIILIIFAMVLISIGVFLMSQSIGFVVTGGLVALLSYLIAPKGDNR